MNEDYYQRHAQRFYADTVDVDMSALYQRFLAHLEPGARILDAGCGSGRDTKAFSAMGYEVDAFDASAELVELARQLCGKPVALMRFQDVTELEKYDGIWCCASLLHVPEAELPGVMASLANALKPGGVWYLSFKYGNGEREKDGRTFTDLDEIGLKALVAGLSNEGGSNTERGDNKADEGINAITIADIWKTGDLRPGRGSEVWLNGILLKGSK
ncbi:bifunctional 2-polyprenyl-6-hydroxyphenol methylase/3-demethylubiquinol 3-O-methyltransferase UbiG [Pantoea sp. CCBC3-3-1]|uniref:class I SAM-dependent methyltransferase n=1 Tax=Pantoea sp. CCBC3-3-1 TaxID=2490851 RepID=UPI0011BE5ED7|nr:class I SAM-dependent methyltransferase [Pantoea sp. CCBC3-3-1]